MASIRFLAKLIRSARLAPSTTKRILKTISSRALLDAHFIPPRRCDLWGKLTLWFKSARRERWKCARTSNEEEWVFCGELFWLVKKKVRWRGGEKCDLNTINLNTTTFDRFRVKTQRSLIYITHKRDTQARVTDTWAKSPGRLLLSFSAWSN